MPRAGALFSVTEQRISPDCAWAAPAAKKSEAAINTDGTEARAKLATRLAARLDKNSHRLPVLTQFEPRVDRRLGMTRKHRVSARQVLSLCPLDTSWTGG